MKDAIALFSV